MVMKGSRRVIRDMSDFMAEISLEERQKLIAESREKWKKRAYLLVGFAAVGICYLIAKYVFGVFS